MNELFVIIALVITIAVGAVTLVTARAILSGMYALQADVLRQNSETRDFVLQNLRILQGQLARIKTVFV